MTEEVNEGEVNVLHQSARAVADMPFPDVDADREVTVSAGVMGAVATLIEPDETGVESVVVLAEPMTAIALLAGLTVNVNAEAISASAELVNPTVQTEVIGMTLYVYVPEFDVYLIN